MLYTEFGKTGVKVSKLGFGVMRLPMIKEGEKEVVNLELAVPLLRRAVKLGVNYFDTAPAYCNYNSEEALGKAIKGLRDKIYISSKNPISNSSYDDFMKNLETSLRLLDISYIDFYHMWGINWEQYNNVINVPHGPIDAIYKAKEQGLIKHISFSFHDKAENMLKLIDTGHFESLLCQYNLLDRVNGDGLKYAHEKGMGTVVMGPVAGGRLGAPSERIQSMLGDKRVSTAETALRFVLANQNVDITLSGMENIEQLEQNVKAASIAAPLTDEEMDRINAMLDENQQLADLYCTGCNYCKPCPSGVAIPEIFSYMNLHKVYGITEYARRQYAELCASNDENRRDAGHCVECGVCEDKCPQKISIIKQLKECEAILCSNP